MNECFNQIYKDKNVLITGHTGFKGTWLAIWLKELGANVIGYALDPYSEQDIFVLSGISKEIVDIRGDVRDFSHLKQVFDTYQPEYVFHLAAQPLVRESYNAPVYTYETNVMGTINVLECIRHTTAARVGIFITTDKCYENKEQIWGYRETDAMGGYDPYSSSKAAAEIAIYSWRQSFMHPNEYHKHGKAIASARAGNVIGGGDWAKDRIIPDCIRAIQANRPIEIRNPKAIRPWEHVLEALSGYLLLGEKMTSDPIQYSEAWNFGPSLESIICVKEVVNTLVKKYGEGKTIDLSNNTLHEDNLLKLDISKAIFKLGWKPTLNIEEALDFTVSWYKSYQNTDAYSLCVRQINDFIMRWT